MLVNGGKRKPAPIRGSYWVEPGCLLAGPYPGGIAAGDAEEKVSALLAAGVRTFLDLTTAVETDRSGRLFEVYPPVASRLATAQSIELAYHRIPVYDESVPSQHVMLGVQRLIDDSIRNLHAVYIHCWRGHGRTGTAVGVWLLRHGKATADGFIEVIRDLREDAGLSGISPSNPRQVAFVQRWEAQGRRP